MNKYKNTINRILKVSMILGLVPISIMGATGGMAVGTSVPVTDASGTSEYTHSVPISQRVWKGINAVINALCCFSGPAARVEEPAPPNGPAKAQVPTVIMAEVVPEEPPQAKVVPTLVPEEPPQAKVVPTLVPEEPPQAKVVTTLVPEEPPQAPDDQKILTNECSTLIMSLDNALKGYFVLKSLELTLPNSRDTRFDEVLKVAKMLAGADCIQNLLETATILSDSEINNFQGIYNTINSEYNKMIEDKSRSTNTKLKIEKISCSTNEEHKTLSNISLSWHTEKALGIIQGKINASLKEINVTDVKNKGEKYEKRCEMVAYNILLENLLGKSGVYSIDDLEQTDGVNTPKSKYLEMARKYNRIKACQEVKSETAVEQDIRSLYMARMLTYSNSPYQ